MLEANVAVKTTDGYLLRLFCIGFTKRSKDQNKKTSYAQTSQVRQIRAKMVEIIQKEVKKYVFSNSKLCINRFQTQNILK